MQIDEDGKVVTRPDVKAALKKLYRNWLLLLSAAGWAEPKHGMKRCSFEKKSTM